MTDIERLYQEMDAEMRRADKAEDLVAELRGCVSAAEARAEAAEANALARVAKLEAALAAERAAHAWRPVTEPPQEPGWYQTVDAWGDHAHASWDGEWKYPATPRFIYWQPIAPLPQEEPTP